MADFESNKRRSNKAVYYFCINMVFCAMFAIAFFTLSRNDCWTVRDSEYPVDPHVNPDAVNTTAWFNLTIFLGFLSYGLASLSSVGYFMSPGKLQRYLATTEKTSRYVTYAVFTAVHVMRLSHTGAVCSGDYLTAEDKEDPIVRSYYMIRTGDFLMFYIYAGWIVFPLILILAVCLMGNSIAALAFDSPK